MGKARNIADSNLSNLTVDTTTLVIDATNNNVGIGTSSPAEQLHVSAASRGAILATGGTVANYFTADAASGGGFVGTGSAHPLIFLTGSAERMRIDSSGNLLVGCTALPDSTISGFGATGNAWSVSSTSATLTNYFHRSYTSGSRFAAAFYVNTTLVGNISNNSTSTSYNTSSDYRLKENIAPMTGALAKLSALKPCTYTWKVDGSFGEGFIAHEIAEVVPQAVTGEKDAVDAEGKPVYQGIDTSFLVATLTASIQELKAIVDAQAERIAVLESK